MVGAAAMAAMMVAADVIGGVKETERAPELSVTA